jgi:MFS family permease
MFTSAIIAATGSATMATTARSLVARLSWNPSAGNLVLTVCQKHPSTPSQRTSSLATRPEPSSGALLSYPAGHYLGRRMGLVIFSAVSLFGAGIMLGANGTQVHGLGYLYGGRVIAGLGVGGASALIPIYTSELSPPAIRGRLVGVMELGWQIGGLVGFWINVRSRH